MALVKPKRKPSVQPVLGERATAVRPVRPRTTPRPAVTTTQPNRPAAPTVTAVPPTPVVTPPPMPTLQSTADRNTARSDYGNTMNDVNRQLRSLAMAFGGAPQVQQFGYGSDF